MKKMFPIVVLGALVVATGFALPHAGQGGGDAGLEKRVARLEAELAELRREHEETEALLEETTSYLQRQAEEARSMMGTLQASEEAGFTAGINYRSREILLAGFRSFWGTLDEDVPGAKEEQPEQGGVPGR